MSEDEPRAVRRIEQWARWTLWPSLILTLACLAMIFMGASERVWVWFLPTYLLVGMPTALEAFVSDWTRFRQLWRYWRGKSDDWT
jgi:hypothetical protein